MSDTTRATPSGPSGRLLRLLSLLQHRPQWSGPDLAERLAVTTRTLRRDIDRLRGLGYAVDAEPGATGGYRLQTGTTMPPLLLDDDEVTAIAIALGVAAGGAVRGVEEPTIAALAKLDRLLPSHVRARVDAIRATTVPIGGGEPVDADRLVTLARAAAERERLRIGYTDRDGRDTERRIDAYRLVSTGRRWYLVGFDVDRADWRTLRVDRIASAIATGHRFVLDDPPDVTNLLGRSLGAAPYRFIARVVVEATPAVLMQRVPATVGSIEPHPDGALLVTGSDSLASLAGHLIGLDLPFEVLEPEALRDRLRTMGQALVDTHQGLSVRS